MLNQFSRTELLFGREAMEKLASSRVAVFGIGADNAVFFHFFHVHFHTSLFGLKQGIFAFAFVQSIAYFL